MKQFTRCTNCQQWYVRTSTSTVEVSQSDGLHCLTVWCIRCIEEAERRSQPSGNSGEPTSHRPASDPFQQCMQEHLQLMDRALYDDEAMLVPVIHDFLERCRRYQTHLESPEQCQRLAGHLQYWETFLKALNS
jgi:hypothetical protein